MNRIYRLLQKSTILLAAFSMLVACAPRVTEPPPLPTALVQVTPPVITPTVPEVAIPTTSPIPPTPTSTAAANSAWIEVQEEGYGYSLAVPCWWVVYKPGLDGYNRALTLHSYDEAFFNAHSTKGQWTGGEAPDGAIKIDVAGLENIDPSLSTAEAAKQSLTGEQQVVESTEEMTLGQNQVVLAHIFSRNDLTTDFPTYVFRLAPEKLLVVNVYPPKATTSADAQAILASLALSPAELARIPAQPPSPAIIPTPESCIAP